MRKNLELQLRALMEALPFASWFKDAEGKFSQANSLLLQSVNKEIQDVLGKAGKEVFDKEDARQSEEGDREVLLTGKTSHSNYSRDNRIYRTVNFPVINEEGRISGIGGYQEDITNLTSSLQALHREKEFLESLLENMPLYIFFTDRQNKYIRINSMMAQLLRVSHPDEAIGKGNENFFSKRVAKKMLDEDKAILENGIPIMNRIIYFEDEGVDGFWMEIN
jgi:PAS domain-containing protein